MKIVEPVLDYMAGVWSFLSRYGAVIAVLVLIAIFVYMVHQHSGDVPEPTWISVTDEGRIVRCLIIHNRIDACYYPGVHP